MATTQDITQGIKVIKINKTDLEGNNNTLSLQELETLRLKLDGLGVVEFKIISISEAVDYYTLFVEPNDIFESKVVGSFLNLNSTVESTPVNGIFTLTPGAAVTFDGYTIKSTTESSFDSLTGQIAPYYPATCTVQVDYIVSQSSDTDSNPLIPYISGSFGKVFGDTISLEGVSTFETHSRYFTVNPSLTTIPTDTNKDLAIETFTPALSASSANSIVYALSTQTKVYISQSEFTIDNNIIPDATLDTKDDTTRTLAAGVSRSISTWDVGQYYDFPGVNTLGPLSVTCSFDGVTDGSGGIGGNGILKIDLVSSERGIIATTSSLQGSDMPPLSYFPTTLSQSFYPVSQDEQFYIQVSNTATGVDDISYRSGSWEINQGVTAQSLETLNVFSPFTTEGNFSISDCNPLINNAINARVNEFYMDVDYSSNAIVAVNSDTILDDSATRAKVQYSNYTSERVTRPRYEGSKNTSPDFNVGYENQLPVVESEKVYFAYFDWIGGSAFGRLSSTNPGQGQANVHVLLLIDEQGNTYQPSLTGSYYDNLTTTFNANGNRANVVFRNTPTNAINDISGVHNVIAPAAITLPLLYSQTGSASGVAVDPIVFEDLSGGETLPAFSGSVESLGTQLISKGGIEVYEGTVSQLGSDTSWNTSGDYFEILTNAADVNVFTELTLEANVNSGFDAGTLAEITVYYEREPNGFVGFIQYAQQTRNITSVGNSSTFTTLNFSPSPAFSATDGDRYRVRIGIESSATIAELTIGSNSIFSINQSPQAPPTNVSPTYWETGSNSTHILTGSKFTSAYINGKQEPIENSGYSDPIPFIPQIGDELRFSANENNVYQIIDVNLPGNNPDNELFLTLNAPISSGTNLDSFLLRRYSPNPNFVLIQTDKGGGDGSGFLLPEFISPELESRFNEIIEDLEAKGII